MNQSATLINHVTIGEAAKRISVSIKTLRRWHAEGLIHPLRNQLNQRLFDPVELERVKNGRYLIDRPQPSVYLTISEAAHLLHLSVKTIRRWDKTGRIKSLRNHLNQRVFTKEAIMQAREFQENQRHIPLFSRTYNQHSPHFPLPPVASFATAMIIVVIAVSLFHSPLNSPIPMNPPALSHERITADVELPPLTTQQLKLATAYRTQPTTTALHAQTAKVTVDAPPTPNNLITTSNNNIEYINTNELNKILNNSTLDQSTTTDQTNRPVYALIHTTLPINSPITDITVRGQLTAIIVPTSINPSTAPDQLTNPLVPSPTAKTIPATIIDSNGNVTGQATSPVPAPTPVKNTENQPSDSANPMSKPPLPTKLGHDLLPARQTTVSVSVPGIAANAVILITFEADYAPATKYWVTKDADAFTLHLDRPPTQDIPFSWVVQN